MSRKPKHRKTTKLESSSGRGRPSRQARKGEAVTPYPVSDKETALQVVSTSFSGPLPPPEALAEYERVLPTSAERLLAMAEKEQEHSHKKEEKVVEYVQRDMRRRQWLGAVVNVCSLATAAFCAWIGAYWVAVGAIFPTLTTIFLWLYRRFGEAENVH